MSDFFASWALFQDAVFTSVVAGAVLGFIGVYVVVRGMVFLSATLAQCAGAGVASGFFLKSTLGLPPLVFALAFTCVTSLVMLFDVRKLRLHKDAVLGFVFLAASSLTLALGTRIAEEMHDIDSILHGSAVAVLPEEFIRVLVVGALVLALHILLQRGFLQTTLDEDGARVREIPVRTLNIILMASMAVAIAVFTQVIGALPVFAFSVLPALCALRVMPNVQSATWFAFAIGGVTGFLGYLLSFLASLPVGASQCLVAACFVLLTFGFAWVRER